MKTQPRLNESVHFGDELIVRETNERVVLLGRIDMGGTLLVGKPGEDPWQIHEDDIVTLKERHGCACCQ